MPFSTMTANYSARRFVNVQNPSWADFIEAFSKEEEVEVELDGEPFAATLYKSGNRFHLSFTETKPDGMVFHGLANAALPADWEPNGASCDVAWHSCPQELLVENEATVLDALRRCWEDGTLDPHLHWVHREL